MKVVSSFNSTNFQKNLVNIKGMEAALLPFWIVKTVELLFEKTSRFQ